MINAIIQKQSHVELAQERISKALARVEAALKARAEKGDGGLAAELEAARETNEALREAQRNVSERLDVAINRLKTILES